jgi:hypothetical protein
MSRQPYRLAHLAVDVLPADLEVRATVRLTLDEVDRLLAEDSGPRSHVELARRSLLSFVSVVDDGVNGGHADVVSAAPEPEEHAARWEAEGLALRSLVKLYGIAHHLAVHAALAEIELAPT